MYVEFYPFSLYIKIQAIRGHSYEAILIMACTRCSASKVNEHKIGFVSSDLNLGKINLDLWYSHLCHPSDVVLSRVNQLTQLDIANVSISSLKCNACILGKTHKLYFFSTHVKIKLVNFLN